MLVLVLQYSVLKCHCVKESWSWRLPAAVGPSWLEELKTPWIFIFKYWFFLWKYFATSLYCRNSFLVSPELLHANRDKWVLVTPHIWRVHGAGIKRVHVCVLHLSLSLLFPWYCPSPNCLSCFQLTLCWYLSIKIFVKTIFFLTAQDEGFCWAF